MSKENYNEIYERAKKNSIGKEKQDEDKREIKSTLKRVGIRALIFVATAVALMAINAKHVRRGFEDIKENSNIEFDSEFRNAHEGNSMEEIDEYGQNKVKNLLEEKGFVPRYGNDGSYTKYTENDWKKLGKLNPCQVYGIKTVVDSDSFNIIMKSMNYVDYSDYLIKNNYVTSDGKPDYVTIMFEYQDTMSKEMSQDNTKDEVKQWK